jgi:HEAT repeat protein
MILRLFFRSPNISVLKENKNIKGLIKAYKLGNAIIQSRAVVALGEIGDTEAVKPLIRGLKNNNYLVTKYTVEALTKIGDLQILEPFISILINENFSSRIKMDIATALTNIGQPASKPLCSALNITTNIDTQKMIIDILGKISDEKVINIIFPFCNYSGTYRGIKV